MWDIPADTHRGLCTWKTRLHQSEVAKLVPSTPGNQDSLGKPGIFSFTLTFFFLNCELINTSDQDSVAIPQDSSVNIVYIFFSYDTKS